MGYDGMVQFDVAMDLGQFQQGIEEISFLLENMQIEGLQQRILEQLNVGENALELGILNGTQFVDGFSQGMSLLGGGESLFATLFANIPAQAFMYGQLADEQFAAGIMSGQSGFTTEIFVSNMLSQLMVLPMMTQEIAYEIVNGISLVLQELPLMTSEIALATGLALVDGLTLTKPEIVLATIGIFEGILLVLEALPSASYEISYATGNAMAEGLTGSTQGVFSAALYIVQGVANVLGELPSLTAGIMPQVFNTMATQMDALAPSLYNKAAAIASNISSQLSAAFSVSVPTTSAGGGTRSAPQSAATTWMVASGESGFMQVQSFADDIRREFSGNAIGVAFSEQLGNSILQNRSNNNVVQPYVVANGRAAGNSVNLGGLTQNFYSPQAPSPAQATQQGIAFLEQARWKLPQMSR